MKIRNRSFFIKVCNINPFLRVFLLKCALAFNESGCCACKKGHGEVQRAISLVENCKWFRIFCLGGFFWRPLSLPCSAGSLALPPAVSRAVPCAHPFGTDICTGIDWAGWRAGRLIAASCFYSGAHNHDSEIFFILDHQFCQSILKQSNKI